MSLVYHKHWLNRVGPQILVHLKLQSNSTATYKFALHVANPSSILDNLYSPQALLGVIPEHHQVWPPLSTHKKKIWE